MNSYHVEPLANAHCETGENPFWDPDRKRALWTDIPRGRLYQFQWESGEWGEFYQGPPVGGFTLQADGTLLLFRVNEVARMSADGTIETVIDGIDPATGRFNDVIADPEGRVFGGTMGKDGQKSGGLFRIDVDGTVTRLFEGTACANGLGFTPDLKQMYWTDSTAKTIYLFDYDRGSGEISNRREFVQVAPGEGTPDGMTVDTEGCVWSARWDGHGVFRYSSSGEFMEKLELPVAKVSSVVFGGEEMNELLMTTAGGKQDSDTADGTFYRVKVQAQGRPEFRSRILL